MGVVACILASVAVAVKTLRLQLNATSSRHKVVLSDLEPMQYHVRRRKKYVNMIMLHLDCRMVSTTTLNICRKN